MVILSLPCLILGAALATLAPKRPAQQAAVETTAGCLVFLGLVLIGSCLPLFR
jgi:purine-cytosine permease-like protein